MEFDHLIIDLVRKADPDLDLRLESQAEALSDLECTNPVLGKWIDEYDVEYLFAVFKLDDTEFASNFPPMAHLSQSDRSQIIDAFEKHFDQCPHCYLKRGYDLEMNDRIERAYLNNNETIGQHLKSEALEEVVPPRSAAIGAAATKEHVSTASEEISPPVAAKSAGT